MANKKQKVLFNIIGLGVIILLSLPLLSKLKFKKTVPMKDYTLSEEELIRHIKLAINPQFENWILFKNGTYIIIENTADSKEIERQGIEKMKKFGTIEYGGAGGDFSIIDLNRTQGWVVSGHGYGMYTYVHPSELVDENPQELEIGLYGRKKRGKDGYAPKVIYIASKKNTLEDTNSQK